MIGTFSREALRLNYFSWPSSMWRSSGSTPRSFSVTELLSLSLKVHPAKSYWRKQTNLPFDVFVHLCLSTSTWSRVPLPTWRLQATFSQRRTTALDLKILICILTVSNCPSAHWGSWLDKVNMITLVWLPKQILLLKLMNRTRVKGLPEQPSLPRFVKGPRWLHLG